MKRGLGILFLGIFLINFVNAANIIPDSSFESGGNWILGDSASSIVASPVHTGIKSLQLVNDGGNHNAGQYNIPGVIPGKEYVYTVWVRGDAVEGNGVGGKPLAVVRWKNSANQAIKKEMYMWASYGTYSWTPLQIYFQAPSDASAVDASFRLWWDCTIGKTYWDDVEITERDLPFGSLLASYQAENAQSISGGIINNTEQDYTGTGYFDATTNGAYIQWSNVTGGGERILSFRYSWEGNTKPLELFVNGQSKGIQSIPIATGRRGSWASNTWTVNLPSGGNTIRLVIGSAGGIASPMIDKLDLYSLKSSTDNSTIWNPWEKTLVSSNSYTNPYIDVNVSITYTGPNGEIITGYGFWDGDNNFKIRNMFSAEGTWTWRTVCSDTSNTGLNNQQGTVEVAAYPGSNILYQKGYLQISSNKRYLTYGDGTPFLWLADTPWAALIGATQQEWESYIQKRKSQHFNVIQIHSNNGWITPVTDRNGNAPFIDSGSTLRWNPLYWQAVDEKVKYANEQGIIVFFTAVRQPGPGVSDTDLVQVKAFARNLAARMMGNFVIYSPVADDVWTSYADESGNELAKSTSVHLITAHTRFKWAPAEVFFSKAYIDFAGMQTGAGWRYDPYLGETPSPFYAPLAVQQSIEWPYALYNKVPTKPVINLEAVYDWKALQNAESAWYEQPYPTRLPRTTAYLSLLSGAKGFTYGIGGIWNWGFPVGWGGSMWTRDEALNQASGTQMQYMYELFSGVDWWNLTPRPDLIKNQQSDWLKKMALSVTSNNQEAIAYLQDNTNIQIDMSSFAGQMNARWYNPIDGSWQSIPNLIPNSSIYTFTKPTTFQDAVLVLKINNEVVVDFIMDYKFDKGTGTIAEDSAGNNDGTINGATWTTGKSGTALNFDGVNDYVNAGNIDIIGNEITLAAWVKFDGLPTDPRIISKEKSSPSYVGYFSLDTEDTTNEYKFRISTGGVTTSLQAGSITIGGWNFIVGTYDGAAMKIYQNGILSGSTAKTGIIDTDSSVPIYIAGTRDYARFFNGSIDEVKIYNRALTASEILNLYNSASTSCSASDSNIDGVVTISELMSYVSQWKAGSVLMGNLMTAISEWKNGC